MLYIKIFLLLYFLELIKSAHDSFKNECGPYVGLEDEVIMPKKEDCINSPASGNQKCCFLEGEKDLLRRTACVLIEDNSEKRIELIQELSEIATKLKVDCNSKKKFDLTVQHPQTLPLKKIAQMVLLEMKNVVLLKSLLLNLMEKHVENLNQ